MRKRIPQTAKQIAEKSFSKLTGHLSLWHQVMRDHSILDRARNRAVIGILAFTLGFVIISLRLFDVMVFRPHSERARFDMEKQTELALERADIVDRNGELLATHLITASVYANPKVVINPHEAAEKLCALMPELDFETVLARLSSDKGFVWIARHISPKLQYSVNQLGIPGVYLQQDQRRIYPYGPVASHIVGYCGLDGIGLTGTEKYFDIKLRKDKSPLVLSLDIRVQHAVHDILSKSIQEFQAIAGNAMVVDLTTGEMIAMVSLPDFDPNVPAQNVQEAAFNRNTLGVYEPGSTFKAINTAIALETGRISTNTVYDASHPLKVGRFTITDFKGKNRPLTVQETFMYSSNIASAKMALDFGLSWQKKYFNALGLLSKPALEIPEVGSPLYPKTPSDATLISNSFGYAISVSPLQTMKAVATVLTGHLKEFTLLRQKMPTIGGQVISPKTSDAIRKLMRLTITDGTAKKAAVPGYAVFGKTGSAYKAKSNAKAALRYDVNNKTTSFIGGFPFHSPKYLVLVMLDSPKPTPTTYGYSTGGWNACPTAGKIIERIAPLLGVEPTENAYNDLSENVNDNIRLAAHHEYE